jgi:xyloglucan-specific endo-beta-1,4-glucanase
MSNLSAIDVRVAWTMKPEMSTAVSAFDMDGLAIANTNTNVAFDIFFDTQLEKAVNTTAPSYEVMVWIGSYGSIQPIGAINNDELDVSKLPTQRVGKEML